MIFREANKNDISGIQLVRNSVKENMLSDPALVSDDQCVDYMFRRGKGWVCEASVRVVGFAIVDLVDKNVWALFVHPDYEKRGIGKKLHRIMLDWYFENTADNLWLGTAFNTRAEVFYTLQGWSDAGKHGGEKKFEMTKADWGRIKIH